MPLIAYLDEEPRKYFMEYAKAYKVKSKFNLIKPVEPI